MLLGLTLQAFTHGIIEIAMVKGTDLAWRGDPGFQLLRVYYAFQLPRRAVESKLAIRFFCRRPAKW
jgi:hypothetical protein